MPFRHAEAFDRAGQARTMPRAYGSVASHKQITRDGVVRAYYWKGSEYEAASSKKERT